MHSSWFRLLLFVVGLAATARAQSWLVLNTGLPEVSSATDIAFGNGRFVVTLSGNGLNPPAAAWSTDGLTWQRSSLTFPQQGVVKFVAGAFYLVANSGVWRSTDGDSWQRLFTATDSSVGFGSFATDGRGMLIGQNAFRQKVLYYSADMVSWRATALLPESGSADMHVTSMASAYFNGRYYVSYLVQQPNGNQRVYNVTTTDGQTWTAAPSQAAGQIATGNGRMLSHSAPDLRVTTDGANFSSFSINSQAANGLLTFAGGRFFFLGSLQASVDGTSFAPVAAFTEGSLGLSGIAYGNGRYVAVGFRLSGGVLDEAIAVCTTSAPPVIVTPPTSRTADERGRTTFSVTLDNPGMTAAYQWRRDGVVVTGATNAELTLDPIKLSDAGRYTVEVRNSLGTVVSEAGVLTVTPYSSQPTIVTAPASVSVTAGAMASLTVVAGGDTPRTFQWLRNGVPVTGATNATLQLNTAFVSDAGSYTVIVANTAGSVTSPAATLSVTAISRISNLSVITDGNFSVGFVVGGAEATGGKPLVIRAAGPSLGALGVPGTLEDPKLELVVNGAKVSENDNWGGSQALADAMAAVGAFPYSATTSKDAALVTTLTSRDNSVNVSSTNGGSGQVIAEVYDATPSDRFIASTPRLLNVSVLKPIGNGLAVGFTIVGTAPKKVLIRAVGPALANFGLGGTVSDPQLTLFRARSTMAISANDNWSSDPATEDVFRSVGAFSLTRGSRDAALVTTLEPDGYSVEVKGVNGATGTALVEVYEVP